METLVCCSRSTLRLRSSGRRQHRHPAVQPADSAASRAERLRARRVVGSSEHDDPVPNSVVASAVVVRTQFAVVVVGRRPSIVADRFVDRIICRLPVFLLHYWTASSGPRHSAAAAATECRLFAFSGARFRQFSNPPAAESVGVFRRDHQQRRRYSPVAAVNAVVRFDVCDHLRRRRSFYALRPVPAVADRVQLSPAGVLSSCGLVSPARRRFSIRLRSAAAQFRPELQLADDLRSAEPDHGHRRELLDDVLLSAVRKRESLRVSWPRTGDGYF